MLKGDLSILVALADDDKRHKMHLQICLFSFYFCKFFCKLTFSYKTDYLNQLEIKCCIKEKKIYKVTIIFQGALKTNKKMVVCVCK